MVDRHGDDVLSDLVRRRGRQLTGYAYLLTGDVASAQDLVQDALVKVFLRTRTGFAPESAEAYVRRAIIGVYVDGFRRRRRWMSVRHLVAVAEDGDGPDPTMADRIDLRAALTTLSPQERACVVLRYYEDLTIADVADQMHLAQGTVKRYLSNAVHKLQMRLGPINLPEVNETIAVAPLRPTGTRVPPVRPSGPSSGSRS
ncbi:MAG TPA: sigma-70 family RNA polymerase sigma factor [Cellulomonadaceae bacterium]|nr:sigma-70 family RNA polymerase sigma factor [Cellulomonadaceae bacterium]